jgi:hypothetical protein
MTSMKTLRTILGFGRTGRSASRFNRYYAGVIQPGVGYPTADEARRDLIRHDLATQPYTWIR